jgi:hypothetical protein
MNVWQYPGLFGASPMKPVKNITKMMESSTFPDVLASSFKRIIFMIRHSEMVASTKVTLPSLLYLSLSFFLLKLNADVIIHLVIQILTQHGPLPIGEIGKQLQLKTGNAGTSHFQSTLLL